RNRVGRNAIVSWDDGASSYKSAAQKQPLRFDTPGQQQPLGFPFPLMVSAFEKSRGVVEIVNELLQCLRAGGGFAQFVEHFGIFKLRLEIAVADEELLVKLARLREMTKGG